MCTIRKDSQCVLTLSLNRRESNSIMTITIHKGISMVLFVPRLIHTAAFHKLYILLKRPASNSFEFEESVLRQRRELVIYSSSQESKAL